MHLGNCLCLFFEEYQLINNEAVSDVGYDLAEARHDGFLIDSYTRVASGTKVVVELGEYGTPKRLDTLSGRIESRKERLGPR